MNEKTNSEGDSHTVAISTDKVKFVRKEDKGELIPVLTIIDGPRVGSAFRFTRPEMEVVIGRGNTEFVIVDETVSRRHARVTYVKGAGNQVVSIVDLGSTNGTFLNGQEINKRELLEDGDRIQIGDVLLRFELVDPIDAKYISDVSKIIKAAESDSLTGLYTRNYLDDQVPKIVTYFCKRDKPVCLLMLDIDHFKVVNDRFGHPVGDQVLRQLGRIIREKIRGQDIPIRYGGEEIAIFLPGCELSAARAIGERLRRAVEDHEFELGADGDAITVSLGLAEIVPDETTEQFIARADEALYEAKRAGRNCLRVR